MRKSISIKFNFLNLIYFILEFREKPLIVWDWTTSFQCHFILYGRIGKEASNNIIYMSSKMIQIEMFFEVGFQKKKEINSNPFVIKRIYLYKEILEVLKNDSYSSNWLKSYNSKMIHELIKTNFFIHSSKKEI